MAKRLTDTEKWKDDWFLSLNNDYRMIWLYIIDNCSHAGIFKKSFGLMNFCCNTKITEKEFLEVFQDRVKDYGNFYFIPKFILFQYNDLSSNKPVVVSVRNELKKLNVETMIQQSLNNDCITIKDKSKSKDKSKRKEKYNIDTIEEKDKYLSSVLLTKEEYSKLIERFGQEGADKRIYNLNNGIMSKGYKYKSHYHTILSWEAKNVRQNMAGSLV